MVHLMNSTGNLLPATASGSTVLDGAYFRPVYTIIPAAQVADSGTIGIFGTRSGGTDSTAGTNGANDVPTSNSGAICTNDGILISNGFLPVC